MDDEIEFTWKRIFCFFGIHNWQIMSVPGVIQCKWCGKEIIKPKQK